MTDPRTQAYLRELRMRLDRQINDAVKTAGEICDCPNCVDARIKNTIPPCELNKKMQEIHDAIMPPVPGYYAEMDPSHWSKVKSIRMTGRAF